MSLYGGNDPQLQISIRQEKAGKYRSTFHHYDCELDRKSIIGKPILVFDFAGPTHSRTHNEKRELKA